MPTLRADLHVHTCHSKVSGSMRFLGSRDCYSPPAEVYRVAKARGMDLVAFTDHDSIDGALELLNDRPDLADVIIGEEVSCRFPDDDVDVHLAVYGMTESLHRDLQPLRRNVFDAAAMLREAGVFFSLNHLLHFYRGQIPLDRYLRILDEVPALEIRNGTMLAGHNALIERIAKHAPAAASPTGRFGVVAGSDAHTLRRVGTTWTEAPGRTRDDFIDSLRRGAGVGRRRPRPGVGDRRRRVWRHRLVHQLRSPASGRATFGHGAAAACLGFVAVSLPFQFMPAVLAATSKAGERQAVAALSAYLAAKTDAAPAGELQAVTRS